MFVGPHSGLKRLHVRWCIITLLALSTHTEYLSEVRITEDITGSGTFKDQLSSGEFGPEMVAIPIEGPKVENCIPQPICDESITDIVRSLISTPYAISKYEITFDDYESDIFGKLRGEEINIKVRDHL